MSLPSFLQSLAEEFSKKNLVVICGAGISIDTPTGLPSGERIKSLFLRAIENAIQLGRQYNPSLANAEFTPDIFPRMPERVIEQFHNVFGDGLFTFLDPFFSVQPNHNHMNLAKLTDKHLLSDIVTLNFDFALEMAYPNHVVYTSYDKFKRTRGRHIPLSIHKPHGTLSKDQVNEIPSVKYSGIRYTVQRIGTAVDESLISWFKEVIGDRSIFVTGYSADDLDVFPALQQAIGKGHVYWNWYQVPPSVLTKQWLRSLGSRCTKIEDDVDNVIGPIVKELCPPRAGHEPGENHSLSLAHISRNRQDAVATLLAAALICHGTETRKHAPLRDLLLKCLAEPPLFGEIERYPRLDVWFKLLTAGRAHEKADAESALHDYQAIMARIRQSERDGKRLPDRIVHEVANNIAYNSAWALKRPGIRILRQPRKVILALKGLLQLVWRSFAPSCMVPKGAQSVASHLLGEFPLTWALAFDIAAPANPVAWALYWIAYRRFRRATSPNGEFVPRDVFQQMRCDEARMNLLRMRSHGKRRKKDLRKIEAHLMHYRYLNGEPRGEMSNQVDTGSNNSKGAMEGDSSKGVHLILEAIRSALDGDLPTVRRRLNEAWEVFLAARYGSGLYRVQVYEWILHDRRTAWRETISVARRRFERASELRGWYKQEGKQSEPLFDRIIEVRDN